ncbi:glycosyl transferase family 4 [Thioclava sp. NG1]|uniref:MraY family glycosyltransferase n=1 Tax=Thioclava sp. NG1 TaxID=2182426 RepID=UPI000D61D162|nr:glycosyltransferase [Thioclava sp. NG1]PWE48208.1 glycosyl transferase family 4 [Thioclava sp. NG1]
MKVFFYLDHAFFSSLIFAGLIVVSQEFHGKLSHDGSDGVQKIHEAPTPRIGGIAVFLGACIGGAFLPIEARSLWWTISLCALPAFSAGIAEDITKKVHATWRLVATLVAGLIFCVVSGYHVERADIPGLDFLLAYPGFAIALSVLAIGGIANSLNIIDGVNGLASGTAIIVLTCFAILAARSDDFELLAICLLMIGAIAGFFVLNFPAGKLFFGDAGAYTTGFVLAVIGIILPVRNPEYSPLTAVLALSYPWIETLVSIHRRAKREGATPGEADRLHLHSLVYRSRARCLAASLGSPRLRNPITSVILWPITLIACVITVMAPDSPGVLVCGVGVVFLTYLLMYRRVALLSRFRRVLRNGFSQRS